MRSRIERRAVQSIKALRASLRASLWMLGAIALGTALGLAHWLRPTFLTEADLWQDIKTHLFSALLFGYLLWNIVSLLVGVYRARRFLRWLEQMRSRWGAP